MARVIGIDPGTKTFDFCGLDSEEVVLDRSVSTQEIIEEPGLVSEIIARTGADLVIGPSGFGIPLTSIEEITERELFLMSLVKKDYAGKDNLGMRRSINLLKQCKVPIFFIPGVIHLPTVPDYRKINKIDMGTADKLCCAALGVRDQSLRLKREFNETSFIALEMGFGYTAAIAVKNGEIVDGIGGSSGNIGFLSMGCMDAELAYLLGGFNKELIFRGGAATFTRNIDELIDDKTMLNAFVEGAIKDILALTASVKPHEILISGRISRARGIFQELRNRVDFAPVRKLEGFNTKYVKEAAQGAALIASGLCGGKYSGLIDVMKIKEAKGTALDNILLPEIEVLKKEYGI